MDELIRKEDALNALDDKITVTGKENAIVFTDYVRRVARKINDLPSVKARETECEKCYWSDERGCSIFCRAWNRYTAHGGYCHQYADMRGEQDDKCRQV